MITQGSKINFLQIPICDIRVTEYQERYVDQLDRYIRLMLDNPTSAPGFIIVKPVVGDSGTFEVLDGHHRFVAHIMTGRKSALCIVVEEPIDTRTDDQRDLEELRAKLSAPSRADAGQADSSDLSEEARRESAYLWQNQFTSELAEHWQNSENRAVVRGDDTRLGQILDRLL